MAENTNEKKKITITVADNRFTVLSSEDEEYSRQLAKDVDSSIRSMCGSGRISVTAAAILTAVNYRDEIHKREKDIELLKKQLTAYLEDIVREGLKNSELSKEIAKLRSDIETLRRRLSEQSPTINENEPISPAVRLPRRAVTVSDNEEAAEEKRNEEASEVTV